MILISVCVIVVHEYCLILKSSFSDRLVRLDPTDRLEALSSSYATRMVQRYSVWNFGSLPLRLSRSPRPRPSKENPSVISVISASDEMIQYPRQLNILAHQIHHLHVAYVGLEKTGNSVITKIANGVSATVRRHVLDQVPEPVYSSLRTMIVV